MDLETAKTLGYGDWLHHKTQTQGGNQCYRIRVNGRPQTWKTRPTEIRLPVRWGMRARDQFSLYEHDLGEWEREADCTNPAHPRDAELYGEMDDAQVDGIVKSLNPLTENDIYRLLPE